MEGEAVQDDHLAWEVVTVTYHQTSHLLELNPVKSDSYRVYPFPRNSLEDCAQHRKEIRGLASYIHHADYRGL
jgi:hypothetical protein